MTSQKGREVFTSSGSGVMASAITPPGCRTCKASTEVRDRTAKQAKYFSALTTADINIKIMFYK